MKVIAINGSPRKNWNTDILCQKALEGAASRGAETELIHLYDYEFKGCVSCLACHLKSQMDNPHCFYKDALTPVLDKCLEADAIIIGSPVYYGYVTGMVRSFMERFLFPVDTYYVDDQGKRVTKLKRSIPSAFIYTMNANPEQLTYFKLDQRLANNAGALRGLLGSCEELYCCDTWQFDDYEPYSNNIFDPVHKAKWREEQFPRDCLSAFELGMKLVDQVTAL